MDEFIPSASAEVRPVSLVQTVNNTVLPRLPSKTGRNTLYDDSPMANLPSLVESHFCVFLLVHLLYHTYILIATLNILYLVSGTVSYFITLAQKKRSSCKHT